MVRIKRAYETPSRDDGYRVLVDRLWPRGVRKQGLSLARWAKEVAPSPALRRWFGHEPGRFPGFTRRYRAELQSEPAQGVVEDLARLAEDGTVTLVYGSRDEEHNGAVVLRDAIAAAPRSGASGSRSRSGEGRRAAAPSAPGRQHRAPRRA